ncbi:MAG: hypothetical protein IPI67_08590 [Myxococcales bacterium]|nr:hypothetical protein [Myxococcales bacterium]
MSSRWSGLSIWGYAFGYFACYVPYSALTKALSGGMLPGMRGGFSGFQLLPIANLASLLGMFAFITAMGWWRFAGRRTVFGISLPMPNFWTFLSGLCTSVIIATTTLAYTFEGVSIVFMMLLMRGGVLAIAPVVDFASRRKVRLASWVALSLSLGALFVAFFGGSKSSLAMTWVATVDVIFYLLGYFVRLRFMSRLAKGDDPDVTKRYFVEEQMTATPIVVLVLVVCALVGRGQMLMHIRSGFTDVWSSGSAGLIFLVGILSQGTGVFGGLILLDGRENSFCVPVNRASSVLAGLLASFSLATLLETRLPGGAELFGALLVVGAILALSLPTLLARRAAAKQA